MEPEIEIPIKNKIGQMEQGSQKKKETIPPKKEDRQKFFQQHFQTTIDLLDDLNMQESN